MRTIKDLAQLAVDVQTTCNLSGVLHSFNIVIGELREILSSEPDFSTTKLNTHPIVQAYVDKLSSLSRIQEDGLAAMNAHSECSRLSKE